MQGASAQCWHGTGTYEIIVTGMLVPAGQKTIVAADTVTAIDNTAVADHCVVPIHFLTSTRHELLAMPAAYLEIMGPGVKIATQPPRGAGH